MLYELLVAVFSILRTSDLQIGVANVEYGHQDAYYLVADGRKRAIQGDCCPLVKRTVAN
jgi:hypothetical protein